MDAATEKAHTRDTAAREQDEGGLTAPKPVRRRHHHQQNNHTPQPKDLSPNPAINAFFVFILRPTHRVQRRRPERCRSAAQGSTQTDIRYLGSHRARAANRHAWPRAAHNTMSGPTTISRGPKSISEPFWGAVAYPPQPSQPGSTGHKLACPRHLPPPPIPPLRVGLLDMGAAMQEGDPGKGAQLSRN